MVTKAKFPKSGYQKPTFNPSKGLIVNVVGETGESLGEFDFNDIDAPSGLVSDLVEAFQIATNSSGRWRSKLSVHVSTAT